MKYMAGFASIIVVFLVEFSAVNAQITGFEKSSDNLFWVEQVHEKPARFLLAKNKKSKVVRCQKALKKLKKIRAKMRRGYRADQQKKLHERELKAMAQRRKFCD